MAQPKSNERMEAGAIAVSRAGKKNSSSSLQQSIQPIQQFGYTHGKNVFGGIHQPAGRIQHKLCQLTGHTFLLLRRVSVWSWAGFGEASITLETQW
jgi:hypothetical protein